MADSTTSVRLRKPQETPREADGLSSQAPANDLDDELDESEEADLNAKIDDDDDEYSPHLDLLRVLAFLLLASCGLSYLVSGGESYTWGLKDPPKYLQRAWWKTQIRGPIYLTPEELALYNGTESDKPIYLAINGTVFDVSANPRMYGLGGAYNFFAGCDASRAFVTGCFQEDRTPDMRGVEEMFLPLDDPETDAYWTAEELADMRARERAAAEERTREAVAHWVNFFDRSRKYHRVGYVVRPDGWLDREPRRALCAAASQDRKKRPIIERTADGAGPKADDEADD